MNEVDRAPAHGNWKIVTRHFAKRSRELDDSMVVIHNTAMCVLCRRGAASSKRNASTNLMEYRIPTD